MLLWLYIIFFRGLVCANQICYLCKLVKLLDYAYMNIIGSLVADLYVVFLKISKNMHGS